jgi:uncharacterized membrane protein YccC
MKTFLLLLGANVIAIMLILLAGYMIYADKPYWGWVLVSALLVSHGVSSNTRGEG